MKKIKALAILMAITLTFSMFATAASAVDVTINGNADVDDNKSIGDYSFANFKATLANANYAALFDFDGYIAADAVKATLAMPVDSEFKTGIVGTAENDNCVLTLKNGSGVVIRDYDNHTHDDNPTFASNKDCMTINAGTSATLKIGGTDTLKPVAIGYFLNGNSANSNTPFAGNVSVTLSGESTPMGEKDWNYTKNTTLLRFYGYKAPLGKYIDSITLNATTGRLRIDDLCIIYDDVSRIEKGVRFYKSHNAAVDLYDVSGLKNTDIGGNVMTQVSSDYAGKKIIMAVYDGNELMNVKISTADDQLEVSNSLSGGQIAKLTHIRTFIWDKDTLVPVGPAAILE